MVVISELPPLEFEARVSVTPRAPGEQAGLYAYGDEFSWVKIVCEGCRGGGAALVFASQHNGSKLPLLSFA